MKLFRKKKAQPKILYEGHPEVADVYRNRKGDPIMVMKKRRKRRWWQW